MTLVLCDNCGDPVEMRDEDLEAIRSYEGSLKAPVVVHCLPCFQEITS